MIDASGTYASPNPLGAGVAASGELRVAPRIAYRIPDVLGRERLRYANKRVLVVGSGHSAMNAIRDLAALRRDAPETEVVWAVRRGDVTGLVAPAASDALAARGDLARAVRVLLDARRIELVTGFALDRLREHAAGLVAAAGGRELRPVDELVAVTGYRPDLDMLREVRLDLDPAVESPRALAPLIDPDVHSCGTVPVHGARELRQPEPGFYVAGMKSYGRAPTFLMRTGYEQVRSVAAALAGVQATPAGCLESSEVAALRD